MVNGRIRKQNGSEYGSERFQTTTRPRPDHDTTCPPKICENVWVTEGNGSKTEANTEANASVRFFCPGINLYIHMVWRKRTTKYHSKNAPKSNHELRNRFGFETRRKSSCRPAECICIEKSTLALLEHQIWPRTLFGWQNGPLLRSARCLKKPLWIQNRNSHVLLNGRALKLADFGSAKIMGKTGVVARMVILFA